MTWSEDATATLSVPAFQDSVDGTGSYPIGICGQKQITLDAGRPLFLTLAEDTTDPVLNNFSINYDATLATSADLGSLTVHYTVTLLEYSSLTTTDLQDSFEFEIRCPTSGITYTEDGSGVTSPSIDLLLDTAESISLPTLSSAAEGCYTVTWNVYRSDGADMETTLPSAFTIVGDTHLAVSHVASDYA